MQALSIWTQRNWLTLCAFALFIASDFKFRLRDSTESIGGLADKFVLLEIGLYGLVALYLVIFRATPPRIRRLPMPMVFLSFYLFLVIISLSYAPFFSYAAVRSAQELIVVALCLTAGLQATRGDFHRLAHSFMVLVAGCVVYGVAIPSKPYSPLQVGRFSFLAVHPNVSGIYFGTAAVIALVYLINLRQVGRPGPHWHWAVYTVLFAMATGGLVATKTRAAVLGAVLGALVALWGSTRGRSRIEMMSALLLGLGMAYLTVLPTVEAYLARGESTAQLGTLNSRTVLWSEAWRAIKEEPIWGHGLGAARGLFLDSIGLGGAHNAVINVAVDLGGLGVFVWGTLVISLTIKVIRVRPSALPGLTVDRAMILALIAFFILDGMFVQGPGDVTNIASTWLFLLVAWSAMLERIQAAESKRLAENREISAGSPATRSLAALPSVREMRTAQVPQMLGLSGRPGRPLGLPGSISEAPKKMSPPTVPISKVPPTRRWSAPASDRPRWVSPPTVPITIRPVGARAADDDSKPMIPPKGYHPPPSVPIMLPVRKAKPKPDPPPEK